MARRLIGTATTDNNGVASITYTGVGAGILDIVAETNDGSLQSEIYSLTDAIFYDKGLTGDGNHNDNWSSGSNTSVTRGDTYTTISETGTSSAFWRANNNTAMSGNLCIEWDNHGTVNNKDFIVVGGTTDVSFNLSNYFTTDSGHIKITIINNKASVYVDDVAKLTDYTINRDSNDSVKIRFQLNDDANDIKYSNFVIYSI